MSPRPLAKPAPWPLILAAMLATGLAGAAHADDALKSAIAGDQRAAANKAFVPKDRKPSDVFDQLGWHMLNSDMADGVEAR
mgnify:CR=1 FL=1